MTLSAGPTYRLFVCDTLLEGEKDHDLLAGATLLGPAKTAPEYELVDLGAYGAIVGGGASPIAGEVYLIDRKSLLALDVKREVPLLFQRTLVRISNDADAHAYVMMPDQVRGRRRLHSADWRGRFTGHARPIDSAFARWAKGRPSR